MSARRPFDGMRRATTTALLGALLLTACGVLDGACWPSFVGEDEICDKLVRLADKAQECAVVPLAPLPDGHEELCGELSDCLRSKSGCYDEWTRLLECLDAEQECGAMVEGKGVSGFCVTELDAFLVCADEDSGNSGPDLARYCWLRDCNDNDVCELASGESQDSCGRDCGSACKGDQSCEPDLGENPRSCREQCPDEPCNNDQICNQDEGPWCSDCGCDLDLRCDPGTENSASCPPCRCNENSVCDPGESRWTCPGDCL